MNVKINQTAADLRVGNLIKDLNISNREAIHLVDAGTIEEIEKFCEGFEALPLTVHWLRSFGFFNKANYHTVKYFDILGKVLKEMNITGDKVEILLFTGKKIEFVHELQNLHYFLTGEELTIKS